MLTPQEIQTLRLLLPPAGVAFDVGAHHGEWTLHVLRQSPGVLVHAFEPSPPTNELLRHTLAPHIASGRVVVSAVALGSSPGAATFHHYLDAPGLSTFHRRATTEVEQNIAPPTQISVPVSTIDEYSRAAGVPRIDFLKIDTEGNELAVLKGAGGMLRSNAIECIQFEYGGTYLDAGITLAQVFDYLMPFDYSLLRIEPTRLSHQPRFKRELEDFQFANYIAMPMRRMRIQ
jgi:FkbM family methyltransferase